MTTSHALPTLTEVLPTLTITTETTEREAMAAHRMLGSFNQCTMGLVRFEGETPWEWHPDDELLHVLDGDGQLTLLHDAGPAHLTLEAGSLFVVPRRTWHRQHCQRPMTLLFLTPVDGSRQSMAEDPRP
jgi:quercetin dioxygenase-like cupin family protein